MGDSLADLNDSPQKNAAVEDQKFRFKAAAFLTGVTGMSILFGFGSALAAAKKKDPQFFQQGMTGTLASPAANDKLVDPKAAHLRHTKVLPESGAALALRALGLGTLYAVTGCSLLFYGVWKASGVNNMQEFRQKVGSFLPVIPRNNPPQGRTEFEGLTDLLTYISHLGQEAKSSPSSSNED